MPIGLSRYSVRMRVTRMGPLGVPPSSPPAAPDAPAPPPVELPLPTPLPPLPAEPTVAPPLPVGEPPAAPPEPEVELAPSDAQPGASHYLYNKKATTKTVR